MKFATGILLFIALGTTLAYGQTTNTPFQHVIVIVQENRTPDNIFGSNPTFEQYVNVSKYGLVPGGNQVLLQPRPLSDCYNPYHNRTLPVVEVPSQVGLTAPHKVTRFRLVKFP